MLDAALGGNLLRKSPEDEYELIEKMTSSSYHPQSERSAARRFAGMHQVDAFTSVAAQFEVMNKRIEELTLGQSAMRIQEVWCEKCGAEHFTKDCQTGNPSYQPEGGMVNHVGNHNRPMNDPFSNTYNPGWRHDPKFSWGGQNNRPNGNQNYEKQPQEEKSSMKHMMQKFISSTETRIQNQDASIKNLENQIGHLAKAMSSRELVTLPSDTKKNPKEQVKAAELRSGKRIKPERRGEKEPESVISEKTAGKSSISTQPPTSQSNIVVPPPFPAALKKSKLDSQFAKFLEVFKKLNINIPFADTLMQMPSYAKFLKEILSNKRKLEEHALITFRLQEFTSRGQASSGPDQSLRHAPKPPPACRISNETVNELSVWAQHHEEFLNVAFAYMDSMHAMMRGLCANAGLDPANFPAPPPYPPPF
ncbi:uncharacterized protein [Henckelia pumila]|uniref:uncharacterized protein n=1 Tax=Henckelia pumila TaxID=405737 RepID=UPI003C6DBF1E